MEKPSILEELELIGRRTYTKGRRLFTNSWLSGHEDKTPSVLIDVEKNSYYDFSTGQYGDSFDIMAFRKGVTRKELVTKEEKIAPEILINEDAKNFFRTVLERTENGTNVIKDLEKRGLNSELREKLEIGMTYDKERLLENVLKELSSKDKKYSEYDIKSSPLFNVKTVNNKIYVNEMFRERVIFPIKNEYGKIVGFTGRTLNNNDIKYLNTSESKIFKKKEFLFNINNALSSIRKKKQVFIVEGPFDVVAYMNAGIDNVVSALTCNVSEQQIIKLLSLGGKDLEFIIAFDNDKAGINGIRNCMELFKQFSIWNYKVIKYSYKDAGEYIEKGKLDDLKELLSEPRSIATYLGAYYNSTSSLSRKSSYINSFVNLVYTFPDFVVTKLIKEFNEITDQNDDGFIFGLLMEKKQSSEILKYILYHLKTDKNNFKMFNLMINKELLSKKELKVIKEIEKYNVLNYKNNYKFSNLLMQFIKRRTKELMDSPF